jgi:iron-sulfur cluster assembly protein
MAVELTEAARARVRELLNEHGGDAAWLRLGIRGGGCSGMSYFMDFVAAPTERDKTFQFGDVNVCIDKKSYLHLVGIRLDFQADLIKRSFIFENPNAKRSCSCGESFSV